LGTPLEAQQVLCPRREEMAIWAGHRHLLFARFLAVALGVCSLLPALGTRCAPIPLADLRVELFGRHLNLPCAPCKKGPGRGRTGACWRELSEGGRVTGSRCCLSPKRNRLANVPPATRPAPGCLAMTPGTSVDSPRRTGGCSDRNLPARACYGLATAWQGHAYRNGFKGEVLKLFVRPRRISVRQKLPRHTWEGDTGASGPSLGVRGTD
jgi:hypothetical protein